MKRGDHPSGPSYPSAPPVQQGYVREPKGQEGSSSQGHVIGMPEPVHFYPREMHGRLDDGPYPDYDVGNPDDDGPHS